MNIIELLSFLLLFATFYFFPQSVVSTLCTYKSIFRNKWKGKGGRGLFTTILFLFVLWVSFWKSICVILITNVISIKWWTFCPFVEIRVSEESIFEIQCTPNMKTEQCCLCLCVSWEMEIMEEKMSSWLESDSKTVGFNVNLPTQDPRTGRQTKWHYMIGHGTEERNTMEMFLYEIHPGG